MNKKQKKVFFAIIKWY